MVISVLAPIKSKAQPKLGSGGYNGHKCIGSNKNGETSCLETEHFYTVVGMDQYI